jgi:hypothetical protein
LFGLLLVVAVAVLGQACQCGPTPIIPPPEEDGGVVELIPTTNEEHNAMLRQLGFATEMGARVGLGGEALPARWHPLSTHYASFHPRNEIYVAGGPVISGQAEQFLDDRAAGYAPLPLNRYEEQTWIHAQYKNGIAVDVDDDGLDELFIVYFAPGSGTLKYILLDPDDGATASTGVVDLAASSASLDGYAQPDLAAGDLDGDGRPEIAVGFGKLYLLSNVRDGLKVVTHSYLDQNDVNVAIGSIDHDPADELVVTHTETRFGSIKGFYEIFDGDLGTPFESGELRVTDDANHDHAFAETKVAIGDVDGDHVNDIVFHGRRVSPAGDHWHLFLTRYVPTPATPSDKHFVFRNFLYYTNAYYASTPRTLALPDVNGDGAREMYGWGQLIGVAADGKPRVMYQDVPGWPRAVTGNVDADTRDDLLVAANTELRVYGLDALDNWVLKSTLSGAGVSVDSPVLVVGNCDGDSAIVRYDGEYELLYTDPHLVTVMASPPWQDGVGQDVDSTTATFGKTAGSTVVTGESMGVSAEFSVGFEYESDIFQTGASGKATFEEAFDFYSNQSKTVETYSSYTTAPGMDKVIFTTVPFDVYYYTIVSSPRASEVGKVVTVNLPRKPQMLGTSVEFYNAHNGGGLDVDSRILKHAPGEVWSYPSVDDKEHLLAAAELGTPGYVRLWNGPIQVDESGSNSLGLSTTQGSARGATMDFSATFEWEVKTGGATVGESIGFHYGHSYEVSTEQGAVFEGTVGAIPGAAYADNVYCYGLMVYPQALAGQRFVVLNWWTQKHCAAQ